MKDFRGKVIFIDVWATWCGPCKAQIPFLKVIEEDYKDNKNIVFAGISIDKLKDRQKWIQFVEKEKLPGIQLLDDFGKSFAQKYGLSPIPRFLLIDKEGRWIEIRCPLPEAKEELKKYFDKALAD
jgi:thiol-disulfide isomerase/thioredoxin